ncbi:MAG: DJ-1/PfpI family protein [Ignavibacteriales bacterium]|nr:DJ-1/PfpI family protein [Ignavibacteriales bacterium]
MIKKSVLLIIPAQNFNEEEYLIITNSLELADVKIFIASDSNFLCLGSNGLKVKNDVQLYNIHESNFSGMILIGGSGMRKYWDNKTIQSISQKFAKSKKPLGAICSAPVILAKAGVLNESATCHSDDRRALESEGIVYQDLQVVSQKNIITAQNPSAAPEFVKAFLYELAKS